MALPASGAISVYQVAQEFGRAYNMAAFYGAASGIPTSGAISLAQFYGKSNSGEQTFTASGTFTVPAGVTSICIVAVGKGGDGKWDSSLSRATAGSGGALGYKNNVAVTPGQTIAVEITATYTRLNIAGTYYTVNAGTAGGAGGALGSGWDGGGAGGTALRSYSGDYLTGGGGAGGYAGAGGTGANISAAFGPASAGSGGGGGGGGARDSAIAYDRGCGGGGVGLYGLGSNGAAGAYGAAMTGGGGGSGGAAGNAGQYNAASGSSTTIGNGGGYGGGGGGCNSSGGTTAGGGGAVRIIWGSGRSFPYAAT